MRFTPHDRWCVLETKRVYRLTKKQGACTARSRGVRLLRHQCVWASHRFIRWTTHSGTPETSPPLTHSLTHSLIRRPVDTHAHTHSSIARTGARTAATTTATATATAGCCVLHGVVHGLHLGQLPVRVAERAGVPCLAPPLDAIMVKHVPAIAPRDVQSGRLRLRVGLNK